MKHIYLFEQFSDRLRNSRLFEEYSEEYYDKVLDLYRDKGLDGMIKIVHNDVMKRIVKYKTFINESSDPSKLSAEQIDFLNRYIRGKWKLNAEGVVDVDDSFYCNDKEISSFKGIKFGKVNGDFNCADNNLTSLEGAPKEVVGDFDCSNNNLTSLEGAPKEVVGDFDCSNNNLTSLEGAPKEVNGDFDCSNNNLTSLEGAPKEVNGDFDCSNNNLTSLEGAPKEVNGSFYCSINNLTSLEGAPKEVDGDFNCSNNKLITLEGAPKKVESEFYFDYSEGASSETLKLIYNNMLSTKSDYKTVLKSLWEEIPIEDKIILYTPDLDWVEGDEASKLTNLKKYSGIKKML